MKSERNLKAEENRTNGDVGEEERVDEERGRGGTWRLILARMVLPCVPAVMDYPTTCIHSRTTQELGNVETTVCVLIKSNETNLRSIMRPLESAMEMLRVGSLH